MIFDCLSTKIHFLKAICYSRVPKMGHGKMLPPHTGKASFTRVPAGYFQRRKDAGSKSSAHGHNGC